MDHWNKAFWLLFATGGGIVVFGSFIRIVFLDVVLGVFVIAMGMLKLSEDIANKHISLRHKNINESINYLTSQVGTNADMTMMLRDRQNSRFMHMDVKRAGIESMVEKNYRELARKIMDVENRLNEMGRAFVQEIRSSEKASSTRVERIAEKVDKIKDAHGSEIRGLKQAVRKATAIPKSLKMSLFK
jgi:uncharacterized protein YoxC